jgi:alkyl sulfatase BDS1-like metallo-beta-lactamase superfamily hydrolase
VALRLIRSVTRKPIHTIIYSHHHGTQLMGAPVLREARTRIVAHEDLPLELDRITDLFQYHHRLNRVQFDLATGPRAEKPYVWTYPTETFRDRMTFQLGGLDFELSHHEGEADDYAVLWIPQKRAVFVADLLGTSMPMVASPMKPVRDALKWRRALEYVQSLQPDFLFFTSGQPYQDRAAMNAHLALHIEFLGWLHRAVSDQINAGATVEEAIARIRLPAALRDQPKLREEYGSLEFAIRGLYHDYRGWFDMNGTHLSPIAPRARAAAFVEAMGGEAQLLARARGERAAGDPVLALEYLDLLIEGAASEPARAEKSEILAELAGHERQPLKRNMLKSLSAIEREPRAASAAAAPER